MTAAVSVPVRLAEDEDRIFPVKIAPIRECVDEFAANIIIERNETISIKPPTIDGISMLESARRGDDNGEPTWLEHTHDFERRGPKKLDVFQRLPRDNDVNGITWHFDPVVCISNDDVDVVARFDIEAFVLPALGVK